MHEALHTTTNASQKVVGTVCSLIQQQRESSDRGVRQNPAHMVYRSREGADLLAVVLTMGALRPFR